jgi:hypothetical protein
MAKSKRRVPKQIKIKIPKALRKSKMFKSLLATKLDNTLLVSALVSAASAVATVLTREESGREFAPVSARSSKSDAVSIVRVATPPSANDGLKETSLSHESSVPEHGSGEKTSSSEPEAVYASGSLTQAA